MQYVTIVNRTSKTLIGTWDGKRHHLAPGKHSFPELVAMKFRDQNPIMGSEDPYTLEKQYLLGIEEEGDDCSPIEQSAAIERFDRTKLTGAGAQDVIIVRGNGTYSPSTEGPKPLSADSTFVKP